MSVKAVKKYYKDICDQYHEMVENIKDLEAEVATGMVEPERVERLKEQIQPLMQNYYRWTYMMFLLNEPTRAKKIPAYRKRNKKFLNSIPDADKIEAVLAENDAVNASFREE